MDGHGRWDGHRGIVHNGGDAAGAAVRLGYLVGGWCHWWVTGMRKAVRRISILRRESSKKERELRRSFDAQHGELLVAQAAIGVQAQEAASIAAERDAATQAARTARALSARILGKRRREQAEAKRQKKARATRRAAHHNDARHERSARASAFKAGFKAAAAKTAVIKDRKGGGKKSHLTLAGVCAMLKSKDSGKVAAGRVAENVAGFDAYKSDGGTFGLRPGAKSTILRWDRKRSVRESPLVPLSLNL